MQENRPLTYLNRVKTLSRAVIEHRTLCQVGALCVRCDRGRPEVLLITTRRTGRWFIPKGWPIVGLEGFDAAAREAWEEAGVRGKVKKRVFGTIKYSKVVRNLFAVPAIVDVYLLEVRRIRSKYPERHERLRRWLAPQEAALLVKEPELRSLLSKLARRLGADKQRFAAVDHSAVSA
ncbi:NUDIX hydrolase [Pararhizobium sp. BT-229]|uniref:NUDIX hydrolase n=1 Tax=Pararhizobium sp. BT-229 TaxID=2986923 RepID=UPI0021F7286E|nr:NUDIX hydrolase [Pararhizobium sp. BT-229]MCV9966754.1 NUDIX hydrolase [Pararhizobium sp. BT-229]